MAEFDDNGDLPVGVHEATIAEVVEHFGRGNLQRQLVARRLERIYNFAKGTGHLARFIVFGSFITTKETPNDVDVFMLMDDTFDVSQVRGLLLRSFTIGLRKIGWELVYFGSGEWRPSAEKTKWSMAGK